MRTRSVVALAALLAGAISLCAQGVSVVPAGPPGPAPIAAATGNGLITGLVVDAAGAPIASAVVSINTGARGRGSAPPSAVLTDAGGQFFFNSLAAGNYTLTATKPGWIPGAFGRRRPGGASLPLALGADERRGGLEIPLWRYAVISGRVLDDHGDPLVGVDVRVAQQTFLAGHRPAAFGVRAITDDRGAFRFSNLLPGDYLVVVPMDITSEPASYAGTIRAAGQTPAAYLQTMTGVGTAPMVFDRAETVAGGGRSLVASVSGLPGLPPADGAWQTYPTTFFPSTTSIGSATPVHAVSGADRSGVDLIVRLTPTWQVSGTLSGPEGPASGYAVHLISSDSADAPLFDTGTAITDGAGAFTFFGVPPGQYIARVVRTPGPSAGWRLGIIGGTGQTRSIGTFTDIESSIGGPTAAPDPLLHVSQPVTVTDRHVKGITLALRVGARVSGHAEFEGSAARPTPADWRGVTVSLEAANGQSTFAIYPGRFNDDGTFASPSTWPSRYLIRATAPPGWTFKSASYQGRNVSETPIDLAADLDNVVITYTDRSAKIDGTVQAAQGEHAAGAVVLMFPVDQAGWSDFGRSSRRVRKVSASVTSTFSMPAPPDGEYFLVAVPDDQAVDWQNPALFAKLAQVADRIPVREGQAVTHALQLRRIQ